MVVMMVAEAALVVAAAVHTELTLMQLAELDKVDKAA